MKKTPLLEKIRQFSGLRSKKLSGFLICLALAFLFWLLNVFNKDYTTVIRFPIKYVNLPKDRILVNDLPQYLPVEVKAHGFNLFFYNLRTSSDTLVISGNALEQRRIGNKLYSYTSTKRLFEPIARQMSEHFRINNILTDTLFIETEKKISQSVPVKLNIEMELEKQYVQNGDITIQPAVVTVSGPKSAIDTIESVVSKPLRFSKLNSSVTTDVELDLDSAATQIVINPKKVLVTIPVEKFTESIMEVPITVINVPDSLMVKIFPEKVHVTGRVTLSKFESIRPDQYKAVVNYEDIGESPPSRLKVTFDKIPELVELIKYEPERVEYIIRKK